MAQSVIFRQLFDKQSSTYTYLIGDLVSKSAILIDTVKEQVHRDLELVSQLGFSNLILLSTHIHADHITGNASIKEQFKGKAKSYISCYYNSSAKSDFKVNESSQILIDESNNIDSLKLNFIHTPGHTAGCMSIVDHKNKRVFTGDTLLIRGCGRTDFQGGSSEMLYNSITEKLFKLPRDYLVYPAHDYKGNTVSTIGEEMDFNPRLHQKSKSDFVKIMDNLNLAYPKMIDVAVPANLNCGYEQAAN